MDDGLMRHDGAANIVFVCLHGSAKSLIAAEHWNRLAAAHGVAVHAESMGVEPDAKVPPAVVAGLSLDGIDVKGYVPRCVDADRLTDAAVVVSFACDLTSIGRGARRIENWNDMPMVSDGYVTARDAIVARVESLLDTYEREAR